jgi:Spy/CpxP family protein refolding chaperone
MKRFPCFRVLAFTALFLAVACMAAEAQRPRGGQRGFGGRGFGQRGPGMGGGISSLLRSEQVQGELKLTEDQKSQLSQMAEQQWAQMREWFAGRNRGNREEQSEAERQAEREKMIKEFQERTKKAEEKIRGILKPEQFKRLKQIELQQMGANALIRPDVTQALGLTEEQGQKLKELFEGIRKQREELREQSRPLFLGFRDANEEERAALREKGEQLRAKGDALQKEAQQKAMALLTDEQKGKLKDLAGEPFQLDRRDRFGSPGGQGSGNRRPQGGRRPGRPQQ